MTPVKAQTCVCWPADLAVLDESEDMLKAVVVEEDGLQHSSVGTLQDLWDRICGGQLVLDPFIICQLFIHEKKKTLEISFDQCGALFGAS